MAWQSLQGLQGPINVCRRLYVCPLLCARTCVFRSVLQFLLFSTELRSRQPRKIVSLEKLVVSLEKKVASLEFFFTELRSRQPRKIGRLHRRKKRTLCMSLQ